jgi:predicted ATPase/class 3 adenylate cyclase
MTFYELVNQVLAVLQREGRVSYRALKREFSLDDDYLEDLKVELIDAKRLAADENGKVLVWAGASPVSSSTVQVTGSQSPASYTPQHLAERIRAEQAALEAHGAADGERKTITALFADLKGSTALIEGLDPEEARAIIDPALQIMMDAVHRYEGYVAQALGDGIFALFGAPIAHEDHPQRALYAALRMQEEMRRYADTLRAKGYPPLLMRVGVNTGEVVVRSIRKDDLHTDYVPVGHSTNLAARMEQLAAPGSILVTEYTRKLTEGYFELKALGAATIKGVEEPLLVYEVLGAGPLRTKLQVAARRGLTRFVGRQSEMEQMRRALDGAKAGHGQIVGVMGEPGLGKSRLFYEFKLLSLSGCLVLEAYSDSHSKASPYLPVIELLKSYFDIQAQDDERKRREKVTGKVLTLDRSLEDTLPYLFALLGIEEQPSPLQQMDPQIRRRTFEALKKLFLRESLNQPLIVIFEDLHWIDTETQGFLDTLSESVASAKALLLVNYRPEYRHEWGQKTYYTQLRLTPLGKAEAEEFLDVLLGTTVGTRRALPLRRFILEKTEGTPFFMEEVVQELFEQGILVRDAVGARLRPSSSTGQVPLPTDLHIPTTVQGVLASRIDRLVSDEKALLQQLAIIGREFPLSLVRQVIPQSEDELYRLLASLQRKEFLYEQPAFPEVEYIFKHALTQEVAYGTVLHERRKALHEKIAQAIEALYHANLEDHYSELAHHYSHSSNTEKAIHYLHLAGQQAVQRSAYVEAIVHLTKGLELLKNLPETVEHTQQELTLQTALGSALIVTEGLGAPEVRDAYNRAWQLCQQIGEPPQLFPTLFGLASYYRQQEEMQRVNELGKQLLTLAEKQQDPARFMLAYRALLTASYWCGDFMRAHKYAEQGMQLYDPQQHGSLGFVFGVDLGVAFLIEGAWALWYLGYPDQALQKSQAAVTLARDISHPYSLAWALEAAAWMHIYRSEGRAACTLADEAITFSSTQDFPHWVAMGTMMRGWALAELGQWQEGISLMQQGIVGYWATGARLGRACWVAQVAKTLGQVGQVEEGFRMMTEAMAFLSGGEVRHYEAEIYRLKGELTLQKSEARGPESEVTDPRPLTPDPQGEAEACFLQAIEIAQKQQAKSLELRAVTSLAQLWQQQGKKDEARQMLAEIYGWFTEGFDTADLQEAKALLEELS